MIIESYELYISTSEPTSARNSNEESPVAAVDEILTHGGLSLALYETAMMESKVVYRLQKYSWKDHLTTVQEIQWKISRSNGMSEKVFSCFSGRVSFLQSHLCSRRRFSVNETDLYANGERDSGTKCTTPEFCLPFACPNRQLNGLSIKMANTPRHALGEDKHRKLQL